METLVELLESFRCRGEKKAVVNRTGVRRLVWSYGYLYHLSLRMSSWLEARGVGHGDRVVLWAPNSPWWAVAFWGIVARGAVVVPVDFMSGRDRAETIAGLTKAKLVVQSRYKLEHLIEPDHVLAEDLEAILQHVEPVTPVASPEPEDIAQLIYTSGTTGNPKGVILTHRNLMTNLHQVNEHIPLIKPDYTFLSLLPLSHMFEQMAGFFAPLSRGSSIVYLRTLKPSAIMDALGDEDVQVIVAVPRLLQLLRSSIEHEIAAKGLELAFEWLLQRAEQLPPELRRKVFFSVHRRFGSHFKLFVSGGAPLSPALFRFWTALGFTVLEGYGLTECSPVLCANLVDRQVAGTVGRPLPGVEIRLRGNEIEARGPNVFPGYYENDAATMAAFTDDGWFRTGDLGEIDETGFLHVKGRSKELIVTGAGINVYPEEVEAALAPVPGVREACVIGLDRGNGEEVHAVLLLDGSGRQPDEIIREANMQLDELHQVTGYSVWGEPEFPKTTTLKIRKFQVKEMLLRGEVGGEPGAPADRLVSIVARVTGATTAEVREESYLVADLGLTSIGRLELVNILEQEYRLDLDDSLIGPQTRLSDLRQIIERREKVSLSDRFRFWTNSEPVRMLRRMMDALLHYPLFRLYVELEVSGVERLPASHQSPVLFIANHMSYLDQPSIMFSLPRRWRYNTATAAWAEFFFANFHNLPQRIWKLATYEYGTLFLNLFPLPQTDGFRRTLRFMGKLADSRTNILVFPEGERSQTGKLLPFRQGLGIMVQELALPVVPVKIEGLEKVFPRGAKWPKRGRVAVKFGVPMHLRDVTPAEIVRLARRAVEEL